MNLSVCGGPPPPHHYHYYTATTTTTTTTTSTGNLFTGRTFNDQAVAADKEKFIEIDAGTYTFLFNNASTGATVYTTSAQSLLPDRIYTLAVRGFTGGTGTQAIGAWVYPNKP